MNRNHPIVPSFFALPEIASTNQYCKDNSGRLPNGAVVYTFSQTAGRGSKGRSWIVEPSKGLALSILLKSASPSSLSPLPLVMGLSAAVTLEERGFPVQLKWPNDLFLFGKKIAGILCEGEWQGERGSIVCGIGLNLLQNGRDFERAGLPYAGSLLTQTGRSLPLDDWIVAFSGQFLCDYQTLCHQGFSPFLAGYSARCITLGKTFSLLREGVLEDVKAISVEPDGRLRCRGSQSDCLIHQADPSLSVGNPDPES